MQLIQSLYYQGLNFKALDLPGDLQSSIALLLSAPRDQYNEILDATDAAVFEALKKLYADNTIIRLVDTLNKDEQKSINNDGFNTVLADADTPMEVVKPDNLTAFEIDDCVNEIKSKYLDTPQEILAEHENEAKRFQLIKWIQHDKNDVKIIIAFSGGKDSIAMVLYSLFVLNIPKERIELWHHEVDGMGENLFDWKCTPSYCIAFAKAFGLKILFSYAKGGIRREIFRTDETIQPVYFQQEMGGEYTEILPIDDKRFRTTKRKFPAVSADLGSRWCSAVAKINVMNKAINNTPKYKNANIVIMTGERRAESTARSKYKEIDPYTSLTKTRRAITWRPIIDWSDREVWGIIEKHSVQPHPCYEMGWSRCSCQLCIFSQKNTWAAINEISPDKIQSIKQIEEDIDFTLYSKKVKGKTVNESIETAMVFQGISFIPPEAKQRWMNEALGEFMSPIIITNWKMPAGALSTETAGAN